MLKLIRPLLLSGLIIISASATSTAQEIGTIQATANVISSLSVIPTLDLQFGNVTPGVNKTVDKTDVGPAGEWTITGSPAAEVNLQFALPGTLAHATGPSTLPIIFSNSDASYDNGTGGGQILPAGTLNPSAIATLNIGAGGQIMVWIGGQVVPGIGQTGGTYSADVQLTVTLTGN
jgi:hypothetical protein